MKAIFFLVLLYSISFFAKGQGKGIFIGSLVSDSSSLVYDNPKTLVPYDPYPDLKPITESPYKIEVRFIVDPTFGEWEYVILTYENNWKATYYFNAGKPLLRSDIYEGVRYDSMAAVVISTGPSVDSIFSMLVANHIFSLPGGDVPQHQEFTFLPEEDEFYVTVGGGVMDGTTYTVEFKVGTNFRRYWYHEPEAYAPDYPLECHFQNFIVIKEIFEGLIPKEK